MSMRIHHPRRNRPIAYRHPRNPVQRAIPGIPQLRTAIMEYNRQRPQEILLGNTMASKKSSTTAKKSRRRRRRFVKVRKAPINTPNAIIRRLSTTMRAQIDAAAGSAITAQVFSLNSAYDPTAAISAQQPLFFDQHMTIYQQYCVLGYKIKLQICSTDNTNPIVIGFTPMTTSTALTDPGHYIECKGTSYKIMTPDIDKVWLTNKGSVRKWLLPRGGGKLWMNDTYCGTASASPVTNLYGHLWISALASSGVDPATAHYIIKVEQIVKFFNPINPARS